ncbi:CDP-alcohol phosphatidyltransferase family protein [Vibrio alginolyticus]|uniref:CDP-alcohol phosphatidyltransferase family protein n=1 Tax=Vibrio alginolyticus TaxID=663 RepID=UPI0007217750|nr:CDP-alcohol phosphatidyltransferase family protein [Vibrio alginolyticus]ALR91710.1 hypothetical protein AT730_04620 [Vibrio alginolyticus]MBY7710539.1 CDP-alcohol phosphatidyltransferase family protein [Vibrio alginolyticus]
MSIYQLKPKFQSLLRPCVKYIAERGNTPNQITILALVITLISAVALCMVGPSFWWGLLPFVLFIRMALNAIDGMLAREHKMMSSQGFVLNELCDLISDAALYLSFMSIPGFSIYALFAFVLFAWLSEVIAILSFQITQKRANHGPMGKSDRAFLFGIMGILVAIDVDFTLSGLWILLLAGAALLITIYRRLQTIN